MFIVQLEDLDSEVNISKENLDDLLDDENINYKKIMTKTEALSKIIVDPVSIAPFENKQTQIFLQVEEEDKLRRKSSLRKSLAKSSSILIENNKASNVEIESLTENYDEKVEKFYHAVEGLNR